MMNRIITMSAVALCLTTGLGFASSDDGDDGNYLQRGPVPFEVLDQNGDGVITADEHANVHRERMEQRARYGYPMRGANGAMNFEDVDHDGNGAVSRDELNEWQAQRMQQRGMGWKR